MKDWSDENEGCGIRRAVILTRQLKSDDAKLHVQFTHSHRSLKLFHPIHLTSLPLETSSEPLCISAPERWLHGAEYNVD